MSEAPNKHALEAEPGWALEKRAGKSEKGCLQNPLGADSASALLPPEGRGAFCVKSTGFVAVLKSIDFLCKMFQWLIEV